MGRDQTKCRSRRKIFQRVACDTSEKIYAVAGPLKAPKEKEKQNRQNPNGKGK